VFLSMTIKPPTSAPRLRWKTLPRRLRGCVQFEPIAAAVDYESVRKRTGTGGGHWRRGRLHPDSRRPRRASRADRRSDIHNSGGGTDGGTDFDKALSLANMMPMLGLSAEKRARMPSNHYFNLGTINQAYTKKSWAGRGCTVMRRTGPG
jgi:hypothetical chaperone protein